MADVRKQTRSGARTGSASRQKEGLTDRVSEGYDEVRHRVSEGYDQVRHSVGEYPTTSVLSAFAVGFGVGIMVGYALAGSSQPTSWYDRAHAERFGRRMLDAVSGYMPESIASHCRS
jgi:hypothetical protein